jgi:phosphoenolpyruvate carboxykinase (ATP)
MTLNPTVYADLLGRKIAEHDVQAWLINTGWTGGPYGVGERMSLPYTRAMVRAVLNRELDGVAMNEDPVFGVRVPESVPGVPTELLQPRNTWSDAGAYDEQAAKLAGMFVENFEQYAPDTSEAVRAGGPRAAG